jgi:hypothetical protein
MKTSRVVLGLSMLLLASPAFAMEGNSEQPHTAPIAVAFAGGYAAPDVGSEQDPGFTLRTAQPLRGNGWANAVSGAFSSEQMVAVGEAQDGNVRVADVAPDVRG